MSPEGRRRVGTQVGGAAGRRSLGLGRGRRPKGIGGLLAEGGGGRSQGVSGTAAAEQPHTRSQASGAMEQVQMETQVSQISPPAPPVTSPLQHLTMRNGALARSFPSSQYSTPTRTGRPIRSYMQSLQALSQPQTPDPGKDPFTSWTPKPS